MQDVIQELERIRRRARLLLILQRSASLVAWGLGLLVVLVLIDYIARWPRAIRGLQLAALLGLFVWLLWTYLRPAFTFRPSIATIALRLERQLPSLRGRLASAVEFVDSGLAGTSSLARRAVSEAESRVQGTTLDRIVSTRLTTRRSAAAAGAVLLISVLGFLLPVHAEIAATRLFNPLALAEWPKRTGVANATIAEVHPRGEALPLRARVTRGLSDRMRVYADYRLGTTGAAGAAATVPSDASASEEGGSSADTTNDAYGGGAGRSAVRASDTAVTFGPWRSVVLTHQRNGLFERLVEPDADVIEVVYRTEDDRTRPHRVQLVPPPAIVTAEFEASPPAYADSTVEVLRADLGPGTDTRAIAPRAILRGSAARLVLTFNKPLSFGPARSELPATDVAPSDPGEESSTGGWRTRLGFEMKVDLAAEDAGSVDVATDQQPLSFSEQIAATESSPAKAAVAARVTEPRFVPASVDPSTGEVVIDERPGEVDTASATSAVWVLEWQLLGDTRLAPSLVDAFGIEGRDRPQYRIDVTEDRPPSVTLLEPVADEAVLPTAEVPLLAEARDDVLVSTMSLLAERMAGFSDTGSSSRAEATGRVGGAADAGAPSTAVTVSETVTQEPVARIETRLRVAEFDPNPGDVIEVVATAVDAYESITGEVRDPITSTPRRIRIIDESTFVEQLRNDLDAVRRGAIRLADEQRALRTRSSRADGAESGDNRPADETPPADAEQPAAERSTSLAREQARLTQGIARQREAVDRLAERLERNRLEKQGLDEVVRGAFDELDSAGASSVEAAEGLARQAGRPPSESTATDAAGDNQPPAGERPPAAEDAAAEVDEAQERVLDALSRVAEALDQGRDAWAVQFRMERLLADQEALEQRTGNLTAETRGRDRDELTDEERLALDALADEQSQLASRARELTEQLREQVDAIRERGDNPELADALEQAADRAEAEQLEQESRAASEQIRENQGERASRAQQQAANTLRNMLEQVEEAQQARAERLLRELDDLLASLEGLIETQRQALADLGRAAQAADPDEAARHAGLDENMLRLNRNTLAVVEVVINGGGAELLRAATLVREAADAQGEAIRGLRGDPIPFPRVTEAEQLSLNSLIEARDLAQRLQEQLEAEEQARRQQELIAAYRALEEQQIGLRNQTAEMLGIGVRPRADGAEDDPGTNALLDVPDPLPPLGRRERLAVRRLATDQEAIREAAAAILDDVEELLTFPIFDAGHQQVARVADAVTTSLRQGDADLGTVLDQTDIAAQFAALAQALEQTTDQSEFARNGGPAPAGGGGGQGGQQGGEDPPLIPPIAELKLLRGLQENLHRSTHQISTLGDRLPSDSREARIAALADSQRALVDLANGLMARLQAQGGPGNPGAGGLGGPEGPDDRRPGESDGGTLPPEGAGE